MSDIERNHRIDNAADFGRVAVLLGGRSSERDVSLDTGNAVLGALIARGVDAHAWDPAEHTPAEFERAGFDRAWIALHGPGGEDGVLQGYLQWLDMPFTGSGVAASALAMDKVRSKAVLEANKLPTPAYRVVRNLKDAKAAAEALGLPLILKPTGQGSSFGMSKVFAAAELSDAVELALEFNDVALAESCIIGKEITVAVLQGQALPSIRIETPRVFYDYRAKYESDKTEYHCPGSVTAAEERRYRDLAEQAFDAIGCCGWGRVDFMVGADDVPLILEVNTVPGMTSHSLVPMAAAQAGIYFEELCWRILETSFEHAAVASAAREVANGA